MKIKQKSRGATLIFYEKSKLTKDQSKIYL